MSRFLILEIPEYCFEEFSQIAVAKLSEEKIDKYTTTFIATKVWNELGSKDVRDVMKVGRLIKNFAEVESVIRIINSHRRRIKS